MLVKTIATGLIGSVLLAGAVFAQSPTTTSDRANTASASTQGDWRTSKVVGLNVYNDNNESIGSINDLLMDKSGNVKLAVISVGGFQVEVRQRADCLYRCRRWTGDRAGHKAPAADDHGFGH